MAKTYVLFNEEGEPVTGLRKIDTLINTLNNLQITDDRPALWRLCESLIKSLTEIKKEHEAEVNRLAMVASENEKTIKEIMYERDERSTAIDTLRKQLNEAEEQVKAMSDLANSAMADAQKWRKAYLKLRVKTPIVQKADVTWRNGEMPDGAVIMSQQAETAREAQEERIPRNGYHKYHIKYYNYGDHRWHETELWCRGVKDVEDWVLGVCGGGVAVYDCKVIA